MLAREKARPHDRKGTRRDQERSGGGRSAVRTISVQCRLAPTGRLDAQCAERAEAAGLAAGAAGAATETPAITDLRRPRTCLLSAPLSSDWG